MKQAPGGEFPGEVSTAAAIVPDGVLVHDGIVEDFGYGVCFFGCLEFRS